MTQKKLTNIPASIRQRLLNEARHSHRPFNELVQYYAIERFLFRLSQSKYAARFILKGALLFTAWKLSRHRSTMDIDLLGKIRNEAAYIEKVISEICGIDVPEDGVVFDSGSIFTETIAETAEYQGIRVLLSGMLDTIRIKIQIDIGFSDAIPKPMKLDYPCVLDMPGPRLHCYTPERMIAEKYQAMIHLETINSRMKDFYDIWFLSHVQNFNGSVLAETIQETFRTRQTKLDLQPVTFSDPFKKDDLKQKQWKGFLKKVRMEGVPEGFAEVVTRVSEFLLPVTEALLEDSRFDKNWEPKTGWR
jgi:hypothetical protein